MEHGGDGGSLPDEGGGNVSCCKTETSRQRPNSARKLWMRGGGQMSITLLTLVRFAPRLYGGSGQGAGAGGQTSMVSDWGPASSVASQTKPATFPVLSVLSYEPQRSLLRKQFVLS